MFYKCKYSRDQQSDLLKYRNIQNLNFLKIGFKMVKFSKGWAVAIAMVMTH